MRHLNLISTLIIFALLGLNKVSISQTCATCPGNNVTGVSASAFGTGNTVSGAYSLAVGKNSFATNAYTYVLGSFSKAQGLSSITIGNQSISTGDYSFVFGNNSISEFNFSMALGHNLHANNGGFVLGQGNVGSFLTNNLQGTLMVGFNSAYPTLFVSRTESGKQSGRVGIGNVTDPQAKLHIKADIKEEASLLLESHEKDESEYLSQRIRFAANQKNIAEIVREVDRKYSIFRLSNTSESHRTKIIFTSSQFLFQEGAVGIGTEEPQAMLDVAGEAMVDGLTLRGAYSLPTAAGNQTQFLRGDGTWAVPAGGGGGGSSYWLPSGNNIYYNGGNVGIGTASTDYKLTVAGGIHAREMKVTLTAGADHVFVSGYKLTPLTELEDFVLANKHLPGVASESEMLKYGLDVGSFQIKLLEKIEELTLYIIQQQKDMEKQQKEIEALKVAVSKP
ncbi:MAG: hypothetical protein Q8J88_06235 [Bacteroidales bacterium]|nr:hypothetical protein [Bacteroidales bacterium]